ncbi:MAG TPA: thiamine pyrophosphate-binding protein [Burkholderiales bacterium]|nr:thiamine pyrophosphate-binding protein [Burkholderiales bacterium]
MRGADLVAKTLARAGVRQLFALSGNHVMSIFDAAIDAGVGILHVRQEAAAVHMADAWGRITEEPGIALVTGGPGHANAVPALYTALAAESPLVLLSGHAPLAELGRGAFQEMRQAEMAAPVAKASWTSRSAETLGEDLALAMRMARAGRCGPVHVSLPSDLLEEQVQAQIPEPQAFAADPPSADPKEIDALLDRLAAASRPLVIAGPLHARGSRQALASQFEQESGIPVIAMESPRGVNDPALGLLAEVLRRADLVVLAGKSPDFMLKFGAAFSVECTLVPAEGDLRPWIARRRRWPRSGWCEEVRSALAWRPAAWATLSSGPGEAPHPVEVSRAVQRLLDGPDAVLVADGGEFGQWAQATLRASHRIINGPAGSIGAALPLAAAAKLALPGSNVVAMLGDGTFGFHAAEIDTAVRYGLGYVALVGNDARWNAEYQIQLRAYGAERARGCELLPTRYDLVAEGFGAHGEFVRRADELPAALGRALAAGRVACLNVEIEGAAAPVYRR